MIGSLLNALLATAIILGIVLIAGLIYASIWIFLFSPIKRLDKRNERLAEANREYNKITVEHAKMLEMNDKQRKVYEEWSIKKQKLLDDIDKAETELTRKQKIIKEHDEEFKAFNEWQNGKSSKTRKKKSTN